MIAREMRRAAGAAHHAANGLGCCVIAACLETDDDEVEILFIVVLGGVDALGRGERCVALAVERGEVRVEHGDRVGVAAVGAVLVQRGPRVLDERLLRPSRCAIPRASE